MAKKSEHPAKKTGSEQIKKSRLISMSYKKIALCYLTGLLNGFIAGTTAIFFARKDIVEIKSTLDFRWNMDTDFATSQNETSLY